MITFNKTIRNLLKKGNAVAFYCVAIYQDIDDPIFTSTSYFRDVALDNGEYYVCNNKLKSLDPPVLDSTVDRDQFTIVLANIPNAAKLQFIGKRIMVRLCFADTQIYNQITNTILVYKGRVDSMGYVMDTSIEGESLLRVIGSNPMFALDAKGGIFMSKEYIRTRTPNDGCADSIYVGSVETVLKWGRP